MEKKKNTTPMIDLDYLKALKLLSPTYINKIIQNLRGGSFEHLTGEQNWFQIENSNLYAQTYDYKKKKYVNLIIPEDKFLKLKKNVGGQNNKRNCAPTLVDRDTNSIDNRDNGDTLDKRRSRDNNGRRDRRRSRSRDRSNSRDGRRNNGGRRDNNINNDNNDNDNDDDNYDDENIDDLSNQTTNLRISERITEKRGRKKGSKNNSNNSNNNNNNSPQILPKPVKRTKNKLGQYELFEPDYDDVDEYGGKRINKKKVIRNNKSKK